MTCKINILQTLGGIANLRAHFRIGQFLNQFKTLCEEKIELVDDTTGQASSKFFKEFEKVHHAVLS
tara:strand:- start:24 stop:221 length:198 start_codon:yes stop_codon:yes gene_type:complete